MFLDKSLVNFHLLTAFFWGLAQQKKRKSDF